MVFPLLGQQAQSKAQKAWKVDTASPYTWTETSSGRPPVSRGVSSGQSVVIVRTMTLSHNCFSE